MLIPVLGMDPSLLHWGLAEVEIDLDTGEPSIPLGSLIEPRDLEGKQIRVNSNDLWRGEQLARPVLKLARRAKVIFAEVPVGSQSARAMASYGICVGILATVRAEGIPIIEVTATDSKEIFANDRNATKQDMINALVRHYPTMILPMYRGEVAKKAEHIADAVAAIHAGVRTPVFQNLIRLYQGT